jgi:hypothetical protein
LHDVINNIIVAFVVFDLGGIFELFEFAYLSDDGGEAVVGKLAVQISAFGDMIIFATFF